MKTKNHLFISILLCWPFLMFGQLKHEANIMINELVFNSSYFLSYEIILNKQIGIEIELGFDNNPRSFPYIGMMNSMPVLLRSEQFGERRFKPAITGKYYFLFTKYGNGAFIGADVRLDFLTFLEEDFNERWKEKNSTVAIPYSAEKGLNNFLLGLEGGYKWVIANHFIIEPSYLISVLRPIGSDNPSDDSYFNGEMFIKIGYRF